MSHAAVVVDLLVQKQCEQEWLCTAVVANVICRADNSRGKKQGDITADSIDWKHGMILQELAREVGHAPAVADNSAAAAVIDSGDNHVAPWSVAALVKCPTLLVLKLFQTLQQGTLPCPSVSRVKLRQAPHCIPEAQPWQVIVLCLSTVHVLQCGMEGHLLPVARAERHAFGHQL